MSSRRFRRRAYIALAVVAVLLGVLALAWRYTPLAEFATVEHVSMLARRAGASAWVPFALVAAYPVAALLLFPRPLLTLFGVIAFGPVMGFCLALAGIMTTATLTYLAGRRLPKRQVERLVPPQFERVRRIVRERGFMAMLAVSIVPVAPVVAVGVAAGAMRVAYIAYAAGVLVGHLPGTLMSTVLGHQLRFLLQGGSGFNRLLIGGAAAFFVVVLLLVRQWLRRQYERVEGDAGSADRPRESTAGGRTSA